MMNTCFDPHASPTTLVSTSAVTIDNERDREIGSAHDNPVEKSLDDKLHLLPRPGDGKNVSFASLSPDILQKIGSFFPLEGIEPSVLACVNPDTRRAMSEQANAGKLLFQCRTGNGERNIGDYFHALIAEATALPEALQFEVLKEVPAHLCSHLRYADENIADLVDAFRSASTTLSCKAYCLALLKTLAAVFVEPTFRAHVGKFEGQPEALHMFDRFFASFRNDLLRAAPTEKCQTFAELIDGLYLIADPYARFEQWLQGLAELKKSNGSEQSIRLLAAISRAMMHLPMLQRDQAFADLIDAAKALPRAAWQETICKLATVLPYAGSRAGCCGGLWSLLAMADKLSVTETLDCAAGLFDGIELMPDDWGRDTASDFKRVIRPKLPLANWNRLSVLVDQISSLETTHHQRALDEAIVCCNAMPKIMHSAALIKISEILDSPLLASRLDVNLDKLLKLSVHEGLCSRMEVLDCLVEHFQRAQTAPVCRSVVGVLRESLQQTYDLGPIDQEVFLVSIVRHCASLYNFPERQERIALFEAVLNAADCVHEPHRKVVFKALSDALKKLLEQTAGWLTQANAADPENRLASLDEALETYAVLPETLRLPFLAELSWLAEDLPVCMRARCAEKIAAATPKKFNPPLNLVCGP
ncbi:MAG: hypothetical protein V4695_11050 [Pseudomonadota bacterium]